MRVAAIGNLLLYDRPNVKSISLSVVRSGILDTIAEQCEGCCNREFTAI